MNNRHSLFESLKAAINSHQSAQQMKFNDTYVNAAERFSLGIEEVSGSPYLSIPVSNRMVDYEEYYQIDRASYDLYLTDSAAALAFVKRCRNRELDERLILKPGSDRGVAT
jgi:hypothetical protein